MSEPMADEGELRASRMAERVGFEPTCPFGQDAFEAPPLRPLRYLSVEVGAAEPLIVARAQAELAGARWSRRPSNSCPTSSITPAPRAPVVTTWAISLTEGRAFATATARPHARRNA